MGRPGKPRRPLATACVQPRRPICRRPRQRHRNRRPRWRHQQQPSPSRRNGSANSKTENERMRWRTVADDDDEWNDEDEDYGPEAYVIVREATMGIGPFLLRIALGAAAALIFAPQSSEETHERIGRST